MALFIKRLHRFLRGHSFYPIALSSLISVLILSGRVVFGRSWTYNGLVWNLFLAWIPYVFSLIALILYHAFPRRWWILLFPGAIWLVFYPNAPYIVTDFLHLQYRPPVPLWYDIGLLAMFSWTGCFLAIASLRMVQSMVYAYLGKWVSWAFVIVTLMSSGLGVYLGRFGRLNSWNIFTRPETVLNVIFIRLDNPFNNLRFIVFILMFSVFLMVGYLMFISISQIDESFIKTHHSRKVERPVEQEFEKVL